MNAPRPQQPTWTAFQSVAATLSWVVPRHRIAHVRGLFTDTDTLAQALPHPRQPGRSESWKVDDNNPSVGVLRNSERLHDAIRNTFGARVSIQSVAHLDRIQRLARGTVHTPAAASLLAVAPGCHLVRATVALSSDHTPVVHPHLHHHTGGPPHALSPGDALVLDLLNEPHHIAAGPAGDTTVLHLHFVVAAPGLSPLARGLVHLGHHPERSTLRTRTFDAIQHRVGVTNLAWVLLLGAASLLTASAVPLLLGGSTVHYLLYIGTYAHRGPVAYGAFLRDALFYKTLSMVLLWGAALAFAPAPPLAPLVIAAAGYSLSGLSTLRLGVIRTWFGVELGQSTPVRIDRFPYDRIPHPMILGAILALIGIGMLPGLSERFAWLVPVHIAFYLLHLLQEAKVGHPGAAAIGMGRR